MTQLRVIRWEAPGEVERAPYDATGAAEVLADLRSKPGEWALLLEHPDLAVAWRASQSLRAFCRRRPDGEGWHYEIVQRRAVRRQDLESTEPHRLYARYLPGGER